MKAIVFGATGMVGQGVLRECLRDPGIAAVLTVGRSATGQQHAKLLELTHRDFTDFSAIDPTSPDTTPASSASAFRQSG